MFYQPTKANKNKRNKKHHFSPASTTQHPPLNNNTTTTSQQHPPPPLNNSATTPQQHPPPPLYNNTATPTTQRAPLSSDSLSRLGWSETERLLTILLLRLAPTVATVSRGLPVALSTAFCCGVPGLKEVLERWMRQADEALRHTLSSSWMGSFCVETLYGLED